MKYKAKIKRDGTLEFLGAPPPGLKLPAGTTRQRFSEIVPEDWLRCAWFRVLRRLFGEEGKVAVWTRTWRCRWRATILIGPHRGAALSHDCRAVLLKWEEHKWTTGPTNVMADHWIGNARAFTDRTLNSPK